LRHDGREFSEVTTSHGVRCDSPCCDPLQTHPATVELEPVLVSETQVKLQLAVVYKPGID
jgi:hypothetical protein